MSRVLWHFKQLRPFRFSNTLKLVPLIHFQYSHQLRSRRYSLIAACIKESSIKSTVCTHGKIDLLRPYCGEPIVLCRPFHITNPSSSPSPLTLWAVSNALTIAVVVLGHQILLARQGRLGSNGAEQQLMKFAAVTFCILSMFMLLYYVTHIEKAPITHRRRFIAFSNEAMVEMTTYETRLIDLEFNKHYLSNKSPTFRRVQGVISRILNANQDIKDIRKRQWNLAVIDMPEIKNAFILPNGNMYVFTGILNVCSNDDEIGFVVSHELSHAVLSHLAEQMSHMYVGEFLFLIPVFLIWSTLPTLTALVAHVLARSCADTLFNLPFSRFSEIEADVVGIQLASKACFDPHLALSFWKKMMLTTDDELPWRYRIEWLSTHPSYRTRARYLEKVLPRALQVRRENQCPPLSPHPVNQDVDVDMSFEKT